MRYKSLDKSPHLVSGINTKMQSREKYPLHQHITQITKTLNLVHRDLPQNNIRRKLIQKKDSTRSQ